MMCTKEVVAATHIDELKSQILQFPFFCKEELNEGAHEEAKKIIMPSQKKSEFDKQ